MLFKTHSLALLGLLSLTLAGACDVPAEDAASENQIGSSTEDIEAAELALGSASCGQIMACYNRCANTGDQDQCYNDCYHGGTAAAQLAANNLNRCMQNNGCRDANCAACTPQKNACIPPYVQNVPKKWHCYARAFLGTCQSQTCRPGELEPVFGLGVAQSRVVAIYMAGNMCWNNLQGRMTVSGKPVYDQSRACEVYSCVEKPVN